MDLVKVYTIIRNGFTGKKNLMTYEILWEIKLKKDTIKSIVSIQFWDRNQNSNQNKRIIDLKYLSK